VHVPIVGLALLPLLGGPVLLLPIHVVLLELIIDPACSLVFEAEPLAGNGMQVPPRRADSRLFSVGAVARALAVGGVALSAVVLMQWLGHQGMWSDEALRLAGLATIVIGNIAMLRWFRGGLRRAPRVNAAFEALLLGVCLLGLAVLLIPRVNAAFGFPAALDARWVLALLVAPMSWSLWRLIATRSRSFASLAR
jgi:Ca2+-transporting ATPase